jgi:hypothetical protein
MGNAEPPIGKCQVVLANRSEVLFLEACAASNAHEANWVIKQDRPNENFTAWASHLVCDDCSLHGHNFFRIPGYYVFYAPTTNKPFSLG